MKLSPRNLVLLLMALLFLGASLILVRQKPAWRSRATRFFSRLDAHGFVERGKTYLAQGDASNAAADFAEAIRRGADTSEVFIERARALEKLNDETGALHSFDLAIS